MRDELLNEALFFSLDHARQKLAAWVDDYDTSGMCCWGIRIFASTLPAH
jgi:hypothetical protein